MTTKTILILLIFATLISEHLYAADVSTFCHETTMAGRGIDDPEFERALSFDRGGLIGELSKDFIMTSALSPWDFSQYPSLNMRYSGYRRVMDSPWLQDQKSFEDGRTLKSFLGRNAPSLASPLIAYFQPRSAGATVSEDPNSYNLFLQSKKDQNGKSADPGATAKSALCLQYGLLDASDCGKALDKIIALMTPRAAMDLEGISAIPLIKKVLTDSSYNEGARLAALEIIKKIEDQNRNPGSLFEDVLTSYKKSGLDNQTACDHTWDLIGLIATRGPNIIGFAPFATTGNSSLLLAMSVIASGASVLDSLSLGTSHPYSYPRSVSTSCDYGKPYHFWMSAYLARRMTLEVGNASAARSATFISELGYQMKKRGDGRDPLRAFTAKFKDVSNQKIRLDLAFASAGAEFGSRATSVDAGKGINVDTGILALLADAEELPPISTTEAENLWAGTGAQGYFRWRKIFSPDSALEVFKK